MSLQLGLLTSIILSMTWIQIVRYFIHHSFNCPKTSTDSQSNSPVGLSRVGLPQTWEIFDELSLYYDVSSLLYTTTTASNRNGFSYSSSQYNIHKFRLNNLVHQQQYSGVGCMHPTTIHPNLNQGV